jgi:hypothetical protein
MFRIVKNNPVIFLLFSVMLLLAASCQTPNDKSADKETTQDPVPGYNPYEKSELTVDVFKVDSAEANGNKGWGYDINVDGKIYIHQPNIPAVMGNMGFSSEEKARKTGEFVINKIKNNIIPPSITPEELDSLGVLN